MSAKYQTIYQIVSITKFWVSSHKNILHSLIKDLTKSLDLLLGLSYNMSKGEICHQRKTSIEVTSDLIWKEYEEEEGVREELPAI